MREELREQGTREAEQWRREGWTRGSRVRRAVRQSLARLTLCHRQLEVWAAGRRELPPAAEWLLDNWYLARQEGQAAGEAFRRCGSLPALEDGSLFPRSGPRPAAPAAR